MNEITMKKWKIGAIIGAIIGAFYIVSCPFFYILFTVAGKQSSFDTSLAPILCEALSAPSIFWFIAETLSGIFGVSPIAVHKFFSSSNASFKLLVMLILVTWSGIGALIGAGTGYLMGKYRGQEISIMKNEKDIKIGILFGIVGGIAGFILTLLLGYLATGTFDWRFPAVIGIGFFGGAFLGSMLKRLQQTGNQKTVNPIVFIMICFVLISQIYSLATGQIRGPMWRMIITTTTIIVCVIAGYFILSSLMKSGNKTKMKKWKKGTMLGALIGGGWTILGGVVTLIIASTGSAPQFSWKFLISSFPLYTLFVPLGLVDWGQRLAPPGLCNFLLFPVVALYWAAIGAFIGYLIDKYRS